MHASRGRAVCRDSQNVSDELVYTYSIRPHEKRQNMRIEMRRPFQFE